MGDRAELIGRLGALSGPDREVDLAIARELVPDVIVLRHNKETGANEPHTHWEYTGSIDDAVALVERNLPGVFYHLAKGKLSGAEPLFAAQLLFGSDQVLGEGDGPSLPIALLLALLSSLSSGDRE